MVSAGQAAAGGFARLARDLASGRADETWLTRRLDFIDARVDLSDHRLLAVLKLLYAGGDQLSPAHRERITESVLRFRYWWDEPGNDSMCHWSESHQVLFGVCEYLAGQAFPEAVFVDGRRGRAKRHRAGVRLLEWLANRFQYGFSEWLSNTFYELDIAALVVLVDHANDLELVERATMVLDLLVLDLALHRCHGRFVASSGRAFAQQKAHPERAEINSVLAAFFGPQPAFDPEKLSAVIVDRTRYLVPAVVLEIARDRRPVRIDSSHGLNIDEVAPDFARRRDIAPAHLRDATLRQYWSMEAFAHPETIGPTLDEIRRHGLGSNRFLAPLMPFHNVRSSRTAGVMMRAMNPVYSGTALERANVQTYRTPQYLLSSAQRYHPGEFGDQQSLWIAALPHDICVFGTHPGNTRPTGEGRPATPSVWVGNGVNPDIAQHDNVLLAIHDLRARRGYQEGRRHQFSHVYFPFADFDETSLGRFSVAGRKGDSYIAISSLAPLELVSEVELVQRGLVTGWVVQVSDPGEYGSFGHLLNYLKDARVQFRRERMQWDGPQHSYALRFKGEFVVDGVPQGSDYQRLDCPWATIARDPSVIQVTGRTGQLRLDWNVGERRLG